MKKESAETFRTLLKEVYGPNPPLHCRARLEAEILKFPQSVVDELYLTHELRKAAREQGCEIDFRTDYGASLIYFLTGCSNVNPLPPHYFCPKCRRALFTEGAEDGWDLPEKECCGRPMLRDGHSIPIEIMKSHSGNRKPTTEYKIPESFMPKAEQVVRSYYGDKWLVVPYMTELERDGIAKLDNDITIIDPNRPDDPGLNIALLPPEEGMPELDEDGIWQTTFQTIHDKDYREIKFQNSEKKEILGELFAKHKVLPTINDLLTEPVMKTLSDILDREILAQGCTLPAENKLTFTDLLRKKVFLSDDREENPALQDETAQYPDIIYCRENMWKLLEDTIPPETGVQHILVEQITERVQKGQFSEDRMTLETEQLLKDFGFSEKIIRTIKRTWFLPPKGKLINETLDSLYYYWFRLKEVAENGGDLIEFDG